MTDPTVPMQEVPEPARPGDGEPPQDNRTKVIAALVVLALLLAGALAYVLLSDDDDDGVATGDTSTTTETTEATTTTETTEATTTSTSTPVQAPNDAELATVVWPGPDSGIRYTTPGAAVAGFATDFIGFDDPLYSEFQAGDTRSGEMEVRSTDTGPPTTVLVRRLSDDNWWVLGAVTEFIELDEPNAGASVANPVRLSGRSSAFEATVNVSILELGGTDPLGEGFVMGGAGADLEPFSDELSYDTPSGARGVVVLYTISARDGSISEAVAAPVAFG